MTGVNDTKVSSDANHVLDWWRSDIETCFIPKCSRCKRRATKQTTKGKYAQENNHRPVNWGYYCQKHWDEGVALEMEAMYG